MRIGFVLLMVSLILWMIPGLSSESSNPMERDVKLLREAFDEPLRAELRKKGFSAEDVEAVSSEALDWLESCWRYKRETSTEGAQDTMTVMLGDSAIVTYRDACIFDFVRLVDGIGK